ARDVPRRADEDGPAVFLGAATHQHVQSAGIDELQTGQVDDDRAPGSVRALERVREHRRGLAVQLALQHHDIAIELRIDGYLEPLVLHLLPLSNRGAGTRITRRGKGYQVVSELSSSPQSGGGRYQWSSCAMRHRRTRWSSWAPLQVESRR